MGFLVPNSSQKRGLRRYLHDADRATERLVRITDANLTFRISKVKNTIPDWEKKIRPIVVRRDNEENKEISEVCFCVCKLALIFHVELVWACIFVIINIITFLLCIEIMRVFLRLRSGSFPFFWSVGWDKRVFTRWEDCDCSSHICYNI